MNVNEMKEMLDRHDGYMRVTIGGVEYDGGAIRLDRNGRVSLELDPRAVSLLNTVERLKEEVEQLDTENAKLHGMNEKLSMRAESVERAIASMQEAIEALKP